jgi:hypothetical protein
MVSNELNNLNEKERELALQILKEISEKGNSKLYEDLKYDDGTYVDCDVYVCELDGSYTICDIEIV